MKVRRFGFAVALLAGLTGGLAPADADEPVLLRFRNTKGATLHYRQKQQMKQAQSLTVMGMTIKQDNKLDHSVLLSRTVEEVADDGSATLVVKAVERKMTADFTSLGKFTFDSTSTERDTGSGLGGPLTPVLERLTGSEYRLVLSPAGAVKEVKGYAEMLGDVLKDNPLASQFTPGDNRSAAVSEQDGFVVLSEKPVSTGDSWETMQELELPGVGKIKATTRFTYEGADTVGETRTARLAESSDITLELALDQGGTKVSGTLTSSSARATIQFDPVEGRVVSIERTVIMGGQLTVDAGGMIIPLDNQQEDTSTFVLVDPSATK